MSLRKSPTLTPALLAANRLNAQKSTGPRTLRGKAWSRLNHLQSGGYSRECLSLLSELMDAPPGRVGLTAEALLRRKLAVHPMLRELAEMCGSVEADICEELRWKRTQQR